jgi:hypothetical protein
MYALFHLLKRNKPKEISPKETCPSLESNKTLGETEFTIPSTTLATMLLGYVNHGILLWVATVDHID